MEYEFKIVDYSKIKDDCYYDECIITNYTGLSRDIKNVTFTKCVFSVGYYGEFINCIFYNNIYSSENEAFASDPFLSKVCEGDLIVYKKAYSEGFSHYLIVKLLIPAKAKRSSCIGKKCRAEYAKVLEIYNVNGTISKYRVGYSTYASNFKYIKNRIIKPELPYDDSFKECTSGIHFLRTFKEAVAYN